LKVRLLLTGSPGIGKTTAIRRVLEAIEGVECAGFYTEERRAGGRRTGFKIRTLDGAEGTLASVGPGAGPSVGKYRVHVREFEELVLPRLSPELTGAELFVIDEIGRMELFSRAFRDRVIELLARPTHLLATVAKKGKGFVEQLKSRNDVELIELTRENRDRLPEELARRILDEVGSRS
jgi:nucleoside-triphosphatase